MKKISVREQPFIGQDINIKSWLTDRPQRASIETQLWLGALAFLETVLERDPFSRPDFMELVRHLYKPGCQQIINDAISDHFNVYSYATRLIEAKHGGEPISPLASFSTTIQKYQDEVKNGNFNNADFLKQIKLTSEFVKVYCNRQSDYENDTCKITLEKSPFLYSILVIKPLYIHLGTSPDSIDKTRFRKFYDVWHDTIYGNPSPNRGKVFKSHLIQRWKQLEWKMHNDTYYLRKAELFYRAYISQPGKLVLLVDEMSKQDKRNPITVKREIQNITSLIKAAVMPSATYDTLE